MNLTANSHPNNNKQSLIAFDDNSRLMLESQLQLTNTLNKYFHLNNDSICQLKSVHFLQKV